MPNGGDIFDDLQRALEQGGVAAALEHTAKHLRQQGKYAELFETRKMQVRHRLGLPVDYRDTGELDEATGRRLEDELLEACREVGTALMAAGRVGEGWMYLRPVGDRNLVARLLADVEGEPENAEAMIAVAFHEGIDVELGFRLVLQHYGTCQAITTLESSGEHLTRTDQRRAVAMLVQHLHAELSGNLRADIAHREAADPAEAPLAALVAERDWLFGAHSYHIDTTHLASTVRAARILRDEASLRLAADLTEYGCRLDPAFQFAGEEPFVDFYPSHRLLFRASLGQQPDEAVEYFRQKAETTDPRQHGPLSREVYVELLGRLGRYDEAIEAAIQYQRVGGPWLGFAPTLLELSKLAGNYRRLQAYCQEKQDLLGYAISLVQPLEPA